MSEAILYSLKFAFIGISIVFVSLALIVSAISLIKRADDYWIKHEESQKKQMLNKTQNIDNITLAIIATAVSTMLLGRYHIRGVRRYLPRDLERSPWSTEGRAILHGSHIVNKKRN